MAARRRSASYSDGTAPLDSDETEGLVRSLTGDNACLDFASHMSEVHSRRIIAWRYLAGLRF